MLKRICAFNSAFNLNLLSSELLARHYREAGTPPRDEQPGPTQNNHNRRAGNPFVREVDPDPWGGGGSGGGADSSATSERLAERLAVRIF